MSSYHYPCPALTQPNQPQNSVPPLSVYPTDVQLTSNPLCGSLTNANSVEMRLADYGLSRGVYSSELSYEGLKRLGYFLQWAICRITLKTITAMSDTIGRPLTH